MNEPRLEILGIIIETSSALDVSAFSVEFRRVIEAALILSNTHLMCNRRGELVYIAALPGKSAYIHTTSSSPAVRFSDKIMQILETLHAAALSTADDLTPVSKPASILRCLTRQQPLEYRSTPQPRWDASCAMLESVQR